MGLTLNFELRLPAQYSSDEVTAKLHALRWKADQLGFAPITGMYEGVVDQPSDDLRRFFNVVSQVTAKPYEDDEKRFFGDVSTVRGFMAHPGQGSEPATFAFLLRTAVDGSRQWFWHCMCKTQYASVFGDDHFVACHLRLVAMLDHALATGINVTVCDEGHYWETRDHERLRSEVAKMNRVVARIAGRFSDTFDGSQTVRSPIFEHPEFERLEGAG